jgi:hypothetical protein
LQLLADEMVVLGLVDSISTEMVRQALKRTTFSPPLRGWRHVTVTNRRTRHDHARRKSGNVCLSGGKGAMCAW